MMFSQIKSQYEQSVMPTYARFDIAFVSGNGSTLYDESGKGYIDFASGIGVNSVGYAHPQWVAAVTTQAQTLAHVSNLYYTLPAGKLAQRLVALSGMSNVFFANSGAEANEGMIKLARKYSRDKYGDGRAKIVTLIKSFHGRTITTLAATGQDNFHQHFFPFTGGFEHVGAGDISALEALGDDVCAIMLEPIQGEGGVLPMDAQYLEAVRKLCDERDILLLFDEVQCGIGRCGAWFAFQKLGVMPDVVSFAKGIAGGLPLGGFIAGEKCKATLTAATHATTFGGNPICCAAALATLDIIETEMPNIDAKSKRIRDSLADCDGIVAVRGMGLMLGVQVAKPPRDVVEKALANGLVCLTAGQDVVRLLPPLVITNEEIDKGIAILKSAISE